VIFVYGLYSPNPTTGISSSVLIMIIMIDDNDDYDDDGSGDGGVGGAGGHADTLFFVRE